jgi:hypothetical protein
MNPEQQQEELNQQLLDAAENGDVHSVEASLQTDACAVWFSHPVMAQRLINVLTEQRRFCIECAYLKQRSSHVSWHPTTWAN